MKKSKQKGPKVLIFDVETSPLISYVWGLFDQNVALNQIRNEWNILSFAAKWLDSPASAVIYADQRNAKNIEDDSDLLKKIWKLLDESDIVITQNGKRFDVKKLNARFIMNGMQPPSSFKHIDTLQLAKKHFAFTSNKLEWMTDKLCKKYKKLVDKKFPGFKLWEQCLKGNKEAWKEMERYNKLDVLSLEELYNKLIPWDNTIDFNVYSDSTINVCKCGSDKYVKNGFFYSGVGKFQRYKCTNCSSETRDKVNLLSKEKKASLKGKVTR